MEATEYYVAPGTVAEATGTKRPNANLHLLNQAALSLWIPESSSKEKRATIIKSAIELLRGIAPTSEIEGMLAAQMVTTHSAAMECLRRAMSPQQTFAGTDQNLKYGIKLMALYARQMEALNRHRGKGQHWGEQRFPHRSRSDRPR